MPNRYSHALVLNHYASRGFISLPPRSPTPPSPAVSISTFDLHAPDPSNDSGTPPLTAVPTLSNSSTSTSTASSLDDIPPRPIQSASSSIVTEIYAPQSPIIDPAFPETAVEEQEVRDAPLPSHPVEEPAIEHPPPPSTSRFSSARDFSSFFDPHRVQKRRSKSSQKRQSATTEDLTQASPDSLLKSPRTQYRSTPAHPTPQPEHHKQYRRLQPIFSTDSLKSLSLEDEQPENPPSPNQDVLPWEYPETNTPSVYRPRGFPSSKSNSHSEPGNRDSGYQSMNTTRRSSLITPEAVRYHRLSRPQQDATSQSHAPHSHLQTSYFTIPPSPSPSPPLSPSILPIADLDIPSQSQPTQSLSRTSSYDSVAPPPISLGPRHTSTGKAYTHSHAFKTWLDRAGSVKRMDATFGGRKDPHTHEKQVDWAREVGEIGRGQEE